MLSIIKEIFPIVLVLFIPALVVIIVLSRTVYAKSCLYSIKILSWIFSAISIILAIFAFNDSTSDSPIKIVPFITALLFIAIIIATYLVRPKEQMNAAGQTNEIIEKNEKKLDVARIVVWGIAIPIVLVLLFLGYMLIRG